MARRMVRVAVGRKPGMNVKAGLAAGDQKQNARADNPANHLGDNVGSQIGRWEALAGPQPDRNGGVQVAARNMADGIGHCQHGQPKGKRDADKPDAEVDIGVVGSQKVGGQNGASAAGRDKL